MLRRGPGYRTATPINCGTPAFIYCGCGSRHKAAAALARPLRHQAHRFLLATERSTFQRLLALRLLDRAPPNREGFFLPGAHSTARNDSAKVVDSFRTPGSGPRPGRLQTHRRARQTECVARTDLEYIAEVSVGGFTYFANCHPRNFSSNIDAGQPQKNFATPTLY